ncbi:Pre-mRNA-splicing factor cwf19 [Yarrowia sp. B02]|nr:Pre-mRNA-splicing factor cwf19 [Yarrowia sp. B02]
MSESAGKSGSRDRSDPHDTSRVSKSDPGSSSRSHRDSSSRHSSSRSHRRHRSERSDRSERHRSSRSSRRDRSRSRESRRSDRRRDRESRRDRRDRRDRSRDRDRERERSRDTNRSRERSRSPQAESAGKWVIDESSDEDAVDNTVDTVHFSDNTVNSTIDKDTSSTPTRSDEINTLNKQIADDLRAKLQKKAEPESDEEEEDEPGKKPIVLSAMDTQMMGPTISSNPEDMTIAEMVAEERRLNHMGNASSRAAETISRDKGFSVDNDYADDNSSRLASLVAKKQIDLKNMAISQVQKMTKVLDSCDLCAEDRAPNTSVISTGTRVYLSIAPKPELAAYSAVIVPIAHHKNTLECDSDEWEEIRNFQKCLAVMYMSMGLGVCFYENAARPWLFPHAHIVCIPVPLDLTNDISPFFQEAFLTSDTEWSQHRKVIQTGGKGKLGFQTSIAKEAPYVHVWLTIDGGVGHIVEDANQWPKDDRFAREVIGGLLRCPVELAKRTVTWGKDPEKRDKFVQKWDKYDWTKQLDGS